MNFNELWQSNDTSSHDELLMLFYKMFIVGYKFIRVLRDTHTHTHKHKCIVVNQLVVE